MDKVNLSCRSSK